MYGIFGAEGDTTFLPLEPTDPVAPLQPSVGPAIQQMTPGIDQQIAQMQQQQQGGPAVSLMPMQNGAKPGAFKAAMPWLIGGVAVAAAAFAIYFFSKKNTGEGVEEEELPMPEVPALTPNPKKRFKKGKTHRRGRKK